MYNPTILLALALAILPAAALAGHGDHGHRHGPHCNHDVDRVIRHTPAFREHHRGRHDDYARDYARTAVRQQRANLRLGCGFDGSRWHTDYRDHYEWVFRADRHEPRREIRIRERLLDDCRRHVRHGRYSHRRNRW